MGVPCCCRLELLRKAVAAGLEGKVVLAFSRVWMHEREIFIPLYVK